MTNSAKLITYSGRVQGVGFRYTAHRVASRYELAGYVKNLPNKTVELFIQGPSNDINDCLMDIADTFGSNIRDVKIIEVTYNPRYNSFGIAY